MFGKDGAERPRHRFAGRDGLTDALVRSGVGRPEADRVAAQFWEFWDSHFAAAYYTEAQATLRTTAGIAGLVALAMGLRATRRRLRRAVR
jgi:hypothetical protein